MFFSKKSIYNIYLNFFTLKGKKSVAKKNIDRSLFLVSQQIKIPVFLVLYFYITKLNIIVETKKVSTRKRTFFVPFPVGPRRRIFLALKWLKKGVFLNRSKIQLGDKLAFELMRVICSKPCHVSIFKRNNFLKVTQNRSYLYYRW